jgi:hypothetical protein
MAALEASHPLLGSAKAWGTRKINVDPNANRGMGHPPGPTFGITGASVQVTAAKCKQGGKKG